MTSTHFDLAVGLAKLFEELGIRYVIGGSVASSLVGEPRSTVDIDIAVDMNEETLGAFIDEVRTSFYVPEADAARAVREHDSFNIIHNQAALKVDLFVLGSGTLDVNQLERRTSVEVPTDPPARLWITSTEDQILRKLDCYRQGDMISDRQWRDIIAILKINRTTLDNRYLDDTAALVGLSELLRQAQQAAIR